MSDTKLKPCPFCGSTHIEVEQEPERCWRVRCIHCWALSQTDTNEADAIAAWNRRSPAPAEDGEGVREALVDIVSREKGDFASLDHDDVCDALYAIFDIARATLSSGRAV